MLLQDLVKNTASRAPDAVALRTAGACVSYGELDAQADRIASALASLGVERGDRVGVWLAKSSRAVAAMQAVLRIGAAYVPIDPLSPAARARRIIDDCELRAVVVAAGAPSPFGDEEVASACLGAAWGSRWLSWDDVEQLDGAIEHRRVDVADLAYILYTSGSTGSPKGVCLSHGNALAFIDWAFREFRPHSSDRFSSHAPFHFDLSVLDLYLAFRVGASVSIIGEDLAYAPKRLVSLVQDDRVTMWYSVPAALILMMEHGGLLTATGIELRTLLFAGEPFPTKHLRRLRQHFADARLYNLYGPTETNVCTYHEVESCPVDDDRPPPIGVACSGDTVWAVKDDGTRAGPGEQGELWVAGPSVMLGYWGEPPQGDEPYRTGDIVEVGSHGSMRFIGRNDQMVKIRGQRVETGEIEAALLAHEAVSAAAVVVAGSGLDARLVAFVVCSADAQRPSLIAWKRFLAARLPRYMIVDKLRYLDELPQTGTGKVDRRALVGSLEAPR